MLIRLETKWANHVQIDVFLIQTLRIEPVYVAKYWDETWLGVKGLSNLVIASFLRNL